MKQAINPKKHSIVFVILQFKARQDLYGKVKKVCKDLGVPC